MTTTDDARARALEFVEEWNRTSLQLKRDAFAAGDIHVVKQCEKYIAVYKTIRDTLQPQDGVVVPREIIDRIAGILSLTPDSYRDLMPGLFKAINDLQTYVKGEK